MSLDNNLRQIRIAQIKKLTQYPEWRAYVLEVQADMAEMLEEMEVAVDRAPSASRLRTFTDYSKMRIGMKRALDIALDAK